MKKRQKMNKSMKHYAAACLLFIFLASGIAQASNDVMAQTVSASFNNVTLNDVLWELNKQTNFTFIYSTSDTKQVKVRNLDVQNEDIIDVLDKCLKNSDLTYTIYNGVIAIRKASERIAPKPIAQQQRSTIQGIVVDETGEPLLGVNVVVKGTTKGAVTDLDGNFSIIVDNNNPVNIEVSYIGYAKQEVRITPGQIMRIVMQDDSEVLGEVVITGYGTFKKSAYAGSASTIKTQGLEDVPAVDFATLMQGNASGVQVNSGSGQPGGSSEIMIRGMGSFNASTTPLYVIDGVPVMSGGVGNSMNDVGSDIMSTINSSDIESITVIKDAAAASLYGSRAANGVVLITTKSGKDGKAVFNLKTDWGFSDYSSGFRQTLSGQERRDIMMEGLYNQGIYLKNMSQADAHAYAAENIDKYAPIPWNGWADWEDALFRKHAPMQNYEFSASGGDSKLSYFSSLAYTDQKGLTYQQDFSRISGRLNVKYKMTKQLELGANVLYARTDQDVNSEGGTYTSPIYSSRHKVSPSDPIYNEDGTYNQDLLSNGKRNPKMASDMNYKKQKIDRSFNTIFANYTIIDNLIFNTTFSLDHTNTNYKSWSDPRSSDGSNANGSLSTSMYQYDQVVWKNNLSYMKTFADKHNIDALIGYETYEYKKQYIAGSKDNFPTVEKQEIENGSEITDLGGYSSGWRMLSYLGRINYNYDNKYFIGASARIDGSSQLHKDSRRGTFWSVSGAWRFSEEAFMRPAESVFSNGKLRLSYGSNGTLPKDYYGYMDLVRFGYKYNAKPAIIESQIGNKDLKWEKNYNLNIGVDFTLFNKINASVEFYNRSTSDLLMDLPISRTTGFNSILTNIGRVQNRGLEVELNSEILRTKDWSWNTSLNVGTNKNKIKDLGGQEEIISGAYIHRLGHSYYSFYVYEFAGINSETGVPQYYINEGGKKSDNREITEEASKANFILYKNAEPVLAGGWSNSLKYKMFDLNFTFTYSLGGYSYDRAASKLETAGASPQDNVQALYRDRWQKPGDVTNIEKFMLGNSYDMSKHANSRRIHSTDHLRLKNITFGVSIPKNIIAPINLTNVRAYFSAVNLLTLSAYNRYDPEVNKKGDVYFESPKLKTLTFGLDIKF